MNILRSNREENRVYRVIRGGQKPVITHPFSENCSSRNRPRTGPTPHCPTQRRRLTPFHPSLPPRPHPPLHRRRMAPPLLLPPDAPREVVHGEDQEVRRGARAAAAHRRALPRRLPHPAPPSATVSGVLLRREEPLAPGSGARRRLYGDLSGHWRVRKAARVEGILGGGEQL
ncbi:V-set and immunoglobulin domain-containing protein 10-like, partial [Striga asiatica]